MVYCTWRIEDTQEVFISWRGDSDICDPLLKFLESLGKEIIAGIVLSPSFDLEISFVSKKKLIIFCDYIKKSDFELIPLPPMCGRFTLTHNVDQVQQRFGVKTSPGASFQATYNAAPTQRLPVITNEQREALQFFRWGLIPHWAKDENIGNKMINARAETLTEKPSFKQLIDRKRCLVVSDGFYEWKRLEKGKQPYRITLRSGDLFAFAGLWSSWADRETGELVHTFSIITTEANEVVREVHDHMPVILPPAEEAQWLREGLATQAYLALLQPYPADAMERYPVASLVNSPTNNSPELLARLNSQ